MKDVARIASVDVSLVSRVVNGDPKLSIRPATRARIVEALEKTRYTPNIQARGLRTARSFTIGFLLPELTNPVYGPIVAGAMKRAMERDYLIVLGASPAPTVTARSLEVMLAERRVDGLLIASGALSDAGLRALGHPESPIVFVNRRVPDVSSSVVVDDAAGAALATQHLIGLGHRNLAHLGGSIGVDTATRRKDGFLAAVEAAGLSRSHVESAGYDAPSGFLAASSVLERDPEVTGMVAGNPDVAIGAIRAISSRGLSVPGDVSVIAIHDHPLSEFLRPALTCVRLPLAMLGAAAVDLLLGRLAGDRPRDEMVEGDLVLIARESTAAPPLGSRATTR